jgi:hypothetical protein
MGIFIRNNSKIELSTLIYGDRVTQSRHFVQNFTKNPKTSDFLCTFATVFENIYKSLYFLFKN